MTQETFDFPEALRRMRRGKKVKRLGWDDGLYMTIKNNCPVYHCKSDLEYIGEKPIELNMPDFKDYRRDERATDWEEVSRWE